MTQHELLLTDLIVLASEKVLRVGGSVALAVLGYLHISARLLAKSDLLVGVVSICIPFASCQAKPAKHSTVGSK